MERADHLLFLLIAFSRPNDLRCTWLECRNFNVLLNTIRNMIGLFNCIVTHEQCYESWTWWHLLDLWKWVKKLLRGVKVQLNVGLEVQEILLSNTDHHCEWQCGNMAHMLTFWWFINHVKTKTMYGFFSFQIRIKSYFLTIFPSICNWILVMIKVYLLPLKSRVRGKM